MPLEPHDELKLAWEIAQMEADVRLKELQAIKVDQDRRYEPIRLAISGMLAGAGIMGAAIGIAGLIMSYYFRSR